jgi:hypothetical protein
MPAVLPAVIGWPVSPATSPYFPAKIFQYLQQNRTETLDAKGSRSDVCKYDSYVLTDGNIGSKKGRVNREGKSWTDSCKRLKSVNFFVFGDATAWVSHCPLRHDGHSQSPSGRQRIRSKCPQVRRHVYIAQHGSRVFIWRQMIVPQ